jgi:hypothetical protein
VLAARKSHRLLVKLEANQVGHLTMPSQWVGSIPYSQMSNKPEESLLGINDLAYSGLPSVTKKKKFYEMNT